MDTRIVTDLFPEVELHVVRRFVAMTAADRAHIRAEVQLLADLVALTASVAQCVAATRVPPVDAAHYYTAEEVATARGVEFALAGLVKQFPGMCGVEPARPDCVTFGQGLRALAERQDRLDYANGHSPEDDDGRPIPAHVLYPFLADADGDDGDTPLEVVEPVVVVAPGGRP